MLNIGIIGAGSIANKVANYIDKLDNINIYAVASRDINKAKNITCANTYYDDYTKLCHDSNVDLIYITTPHNFHYQHIKLALENNKNVICEKPFCINSKQASEVINLAKEKGLYLQEAMWTRFMPSRFIIEDIINSKDIGEITQIDANIGYPITDKDRIVKKELAGGALLDIGIYPVSFTTTFLGYDYDSIKACSILNENGVDLITNIVIKYPNKMATLSANVCSKTSNEAFIYGTNGYIKIDNVNNPKVIEVFDNFQTLLKTYKMDENMSGYEYQFIEADNAINNNLLEPSMHTSDDILKILSILDDIRNQIGVIY